MCQEKVNLTRKILLFKKIDIIKFIDLQIFTMIKIRKEKIMKILCIGQSAYDITLPVTDYPRENKKIKIGNSKVECGGGACNNAAYLLGLWQDEVYLASSIGKDFYGERIKEEKSAFFTRVFISRICSTS